MEISHLLWPQNMTSPARFAFSSRDGSLTPDRDELSKRDTNRCRDGKELIIDLEPCARRRLSSAMVENQFSSIRSLFCTFPLSQLRFARVLVMDSFCSQFVGIRTIFLPLLSSLSQCPFFTSRAVRLCWGASSCRTTFLNFLFFALPKLLGARPTTSPELGR